MLAYSTGKIHGIHQLCNGRPNLTNLAVLSHKTYEMKSPKIKILFTGMLAILILDSIGSVTSRLWEYDYNSLWPMSYTVYAAAGFFIHRLTCKLRIAFAYGMLLGLFDATIGLWVSTTLDANVIDKMELSTQFIVFIIIVVPLISGIVSSVGGLMDRVMGKFLVSRKN